MWLSITKSPHLQISKSLSGQCLSFLRAWLPIDVPDRHHDGPLTVTDRLGATVSGSFTVTVNDHTAPAIAEHGNESAVATGPSGAVVSYTSPATEDAVDGAGSASCSPATGSTFAIGTMTVSCSATDAAGNHAAGTTFTVTVTDTTTPGEMSGDGFIRDDNARYLFSFRAREDDLLERARLSVRIDDEGRKKKDKKGSNRPRDDRFESRTVTFIAFSDDPTIRPGKARRPQIDTVLFRGVGEWNGQGGYAYEAFAQDEGEPGRHRESIRVTIRNRAGAIVASFEGELDGGNIQSRRLKR